MRQRARLKHCLSAGVALAALLTDGGAMAGQNAIKIGVMIDGSGFAQDTGGAGAVTAAEMAAADYGGTALGKPIRIISADMQNKPDVASSIARQWFDQDQVDAITDLPVSSVGLAVQQVGKEKKKVLLISAAATTELTGAQCSPTSIQWADDTAALANGTARAIVASGGKKWFFITADFAFGAAMESAASAVIKASGGEVVGDVKHPLGTNDFSSYLLKAQASGANIIGLANVGLDSIATIRQAGEFGITQAGQQLAGFIVFISDIHSLGLKTAQGTYVTTGYYWDDSDGTRAFAKRFFEKRQRMPTKEQANTYAALPEGDRRGQDRRCGTGHGRDEGDADRLFRPQGLDPRGWPCAIRPGALSGEKARGVEISLGLLQEDPRYPGGRGVPAAGRRRLSVRQVGASALARLYVDAVIRTD